MKKILAIAIPIALLFCSATTFGQSTSKTQPLKSDIANKTAAQAVADTILTGALTKSQSAEITGYNDMVSVQVTFNRISGATAGKAYLLGSIDGTNYAPVDSVTLVNVAKQSKIFSVVPSKYVRYQIQAVGTGTQSTRFNSIALIRKK